MKATFNFVTGYIKNLRKYGEVEVDEIVIRLNDQEVSLYYQLAAGLSTTITNMLLQDRTCREAPFNINFKNKENSKRIIGIFSNLNSVDLVLTEDDLVDFAKFGVEFGNAQFIMPLKETLKKLLDNGIKVENVLKIIKYKGIIPATPEEPFSIDEEIKFIASHFSEMLKSDKFFKWCNKPINEERVEQIITSPSFKCQNGDDLLNFLIKLNASEYRFMNLFTCVNYGACSQECFKSFIEYMQSHDILKEKRYRDMFMECVMNRTMSGAPVNVSNKDDEIRKLTTQVNTMRKEITKLKEEIKGLKSK